MIGVQFDKIKIVFSHRSDNGLTEDIALFQQDNTISKSIVYNFFIFNLKKNPKFNIFI